jgi:hypothetical protein
MASVLYRLRSETHRSPPSEAAVADRMQLTRARRASLHSASSRHYEDKTDAPSVRYRLRCFTRAKRTARLTAVRFNKIDGNVGSVPYRLRSFTRAGFWCALDAQLAPRAVPPPRTGASTACKIKSLGSEDPSYIGISSFCALVPSSLATHHSPLPFYSTVPRLEILASG